MPRIGGAFPLPTAQVSEGSNRIQLASGGVWYFPSGEYVVLNDANTITQIWDPIETVWRTFMAASTGGYIATDGFNFRALNTTGVLSSVTLTAGSGMTNGIGTASGVTATIAASNTTGGARATVYPIIGGSVAAPTITQAGSGFLVPPLVVIDPPPTGGVQATATAALSSTGTIASITMQNVGAGYAVSPNFYLIPQPAIYQGGPTGGGTVAAGSIPAPGLVYPANAVPGNQNTSATGCQLTSIALTGSGTMTGLIIVNAGGGYTSANPAVTFVGGAGGIASTATVSNTTPATSVVLVQPRVQ